MLSVVSVVIYVILLRGVGNINFLIEMVKNEKSKDTKKKKTDLPKGQEKAWKLIFIVITSVIASASIIGSTVYGVVVSKTNGTVEESRNELVTKEAFRITFVTHLLINLRLKKC